jgi:hypothetical protein
MSRSLLVAAMAALGVAAAGGAHGQTARAAVLADTIRVGDVVPVAVRVTVGPGERVGLPLLLPLEGPDLENVARVQERVETLDDGTSQVTGVYTVTPWRPGPAALPPLAVHVQDPGGTARTVQVTLPELEVVSVLPAAADLVDPMPPKDVLGRSFAWWPLLLLLLVLLALLAVGIWWARRRRRTPEAVAAPVPAVPPRERALEALRKARDAGHVERGEWKEFYTRVSMALRDYLDAVDPAWGEDLTTTEVVARVRQAAGPEAAASLAGLLRPADQVKFARRVPTGQEALDEWAAAVSWLQSFQWPPRGELEAAA